MRALRTAAVAEAPLDLVDRIEARRLTQPERDALGDLFSAVMAALAAIEQRDATAAHDFMSGWLQVTEQYSALQATFEQQPSRRRSGGGRSGR